MNIPRRALVLFAPSTRIHARPSRRAFSTTTEEATLTAWYDAEPKKTRTRPGTAAQLNGASTGAQRPEPGATRPPLQPYELSQRLIRTCQRGDAELAWTMLQRAPRNAQNIKVWNTLIQQCMEAKKYRLAFQVFTDLKRRSFTPSIRTYATMMGGYATIDDWSAFTKQLAFVHSIYDQLKTHLDESPASLTDPAGDSGISFILYPIALYISILGKAGLYQKAFDVFHELDNDGPMAPHPKVYSSLLCALADRLDNADPEIAAQTVSDGKYVWRRMLRTIEKQPSFTIEPRAIESITKVLSRGEVADHKLLFDILRDYCGLPRPGEKRVPVKTLPSDWQLKEILDGCIAAGRADMAVHYAQTFMDDIELRPALRGPHLHKLVQAHLILAREGITSSARSENVAAWVEWMVAQGGDDLVPHKFTIASALELCSRCADMSSALRIARALLENPVNHTMSAGAWVHLFRAALVAPPEDKAQCLDLLCKHHRPNVWEMPASFDKMPHREKKDNVSLSLFIVQMLRTMLPEPAPGSVDPADVARYKRWSRLRERVVAFLDKSRSRS
ncbi:hypothetical protein BC834DRAFT_968402 [Gloeopeniophorella convolvens]|nr:hypothetical protein BC834DRAFT_968402 [Gloeopeniophorella convolvens]